MEWEYRKRGVAKYGKKKWNSEYDTIPLAERQALSKEVRDMFRGVQKFQKVERLTAEREQKLNELAPLVILTQLKDMFYWLTIRKEEYDRDQERVWTEFVRRLTKLGFSATIVGTELYRLGVNMTQEHFDAFIRAQTDL
jgi:hypothetical protein